MFSTFQEHSACVHWLLGYLQILCQLQRLYRVQWNEKIIVNGECWRIRIGVIVAYFTVLTQHLPGETEDPADIRTGYLPHTSLVERHDWISVPWMFVCSLGICELITLYNCSLLIIPTSQFHNNEINMSNDLLVKKKGPLNYYSKLQSVETSSTRSLIHNAYRLSSQAHSDTRVWSSTLLTCLLRVVLRHRDNLTFTCA